jgi:hypothetical protein
MRRPIVSMVLATVVVVLLFVALIAAAWRLDLLKYAAAHGGGYPAAAAIAFVGVLITAITSALGIFLKYSIDVRAEERLSIDSKRNRALQSEGEERLRIESERNASTQQQAEDRLKLEAATEVVKLLAMPDGRLPPHIQRAGALFTLSSLGQHQLTIALVSELLPKGQLESRTAASLLNTALMSGDTDTQGQTVGLLLENIDRFLTTNGFEFPDIIMRGDAVGQYVRDWSPILLGKLLLSRPLEHWQQYPYAANAIIAAIALSWFDKNENAGAILQIILPAFPQLQHLIHPKRSIDVDAVRSAVAALAPKTAAAASLCADLQLWCGMPT